MGIHHVWGILPAAMRHRAVRPCLSVVSALLLLAVAVPQLHAQRGALVAPRSLDQLTDQAELIVHGHVTSARVEPHPQLKNLTTVVVTMAVFETLKGTPQHTLQFRQYIWDPRDRLDAARYWKGQELLLMLGPVSQYGLTSPVGLEQGRFRILRDAQGNALAVNGRGNSGLFAHTATRAQARGLALSSRAAALVGRTRAGAVPLSDLEDVVRTLVRPAR